MAGLNDKKKILLIDDDEIHLITAELFLKDEYEIYKAKSGNEALTSLSNNEFVPDLIMLDLIMPDMDGWEAYKRIRAKGPLKNTPIAFVTSEGGNEEKKRAYTMGAAEYIIKPFNMTDLKSRIKEILRKAQK